MIGSETSQRDMLLSDEKWIVMAVHKAVLTWMEPSHEEKNEGSWTSSANWSGPDVLQQEKEREYAGTLRMRSTERTQNRRRGRDYKSQRY